MDSSGVPEAVQELRRRLVVRTRLGGRYCRWGSFLSQLVIQYLQRLRAAELLPEFTEYLASRSAPY